MSSGTETEPRWLKNLEKVFEFTFKLSFILVAILSSYIIWMLLFGWAFFAFRLAVWGSMPLATWSLDRSANLRALAKETDGHTPRVVFNTRPLKRYWRLQLLLFLEVIRS